MLCGGMDTKPANRASPAHRGHFTDVATKTAFVDLYTIGRSRNGSRPALDQAGPRRKREADQGHGSRLNARPCRTHWRRWGGVSIILDADECAVLQASLCQRETLFENDYDAFAAAYDADNENNAWNAYHERPAVLSAAGDVSGRRELDAESQKISLRRCRCLRRPQSLMPSRPLIVMRVAVSRAISFSWGAAESR